MSEAIDFIATIAILIAMAIALEAMSGDDTRPA